MSDEEIGVEQNGPDQGAGARLRAARETQGLRVATVAEALGLPTAVILALENDDYDRLGAPVYVRGYLRKYAHFLDLPDNELVAAYEQTSVPHEPELQPHLAANFPHHRGRRWLTVVVTLLVVAVIIVVAFWAWQYLRRAQETAAIPPAATASAAPAFVQRGPTNGTSVATRGPAFAGTPASMVSPGTATLAIVPPALPGTGAISGTPPGATAVATEASALPAESRLVLRVRSTSWIAVRAADHTRLFYNLAPSGTVLNFDGGHGALTVFLGNAPGVDVEVNGRPFPIPESSRSGNTARFEVTLAAPAVTSGSQ